MKKKIIRKLNDFSLRRKIIISIIVFLMIPSIMISLVVSNEIRSMVYDNAYRLSRENLTRAADRTRDAIEIALHISDRISVDKELEALLNHRYSDSLETFIRYREYTRFRDHLLYSPILYKIKIYFENDTLLNNWSFIPLDPETRETPWFQEALDARGANMWLSFKDVTKDENSTFSLVRMINFPRFGTWGVLVIDLDTTRLSSILAQESFNTFLVDDQGFIFAAGDPEMRGLRYEGYKTSESYFQTLETSGQLQYERIPLRNSVNGITILSVFTLDTITLEMRSIWTRALSLMLVLFALGLGFLAFIFSVFVRRLVTVARGMDVVAGGHFHQFLPVDGTDEIGQLGQRFNNMVSNIQELMDEIHQSNEDKLRVEQHQSDIKLKMLASQINPHFLFNSLEAIRMKAHIEKQPEIANIVKLLGKLMRRVLEVEGKSGPLQNEIEIIQTFLYIEQFRLDSKLQFEIDIPQELLTLELPPLLLQPLVENAVVHGIEKSIGKGLIRIQGRLRGKRLFLSVEDNGPGVSPEKMAVLQEHLESGTYVAKENKLRRGHIGMSNVQERLILTYGNESHLDFWKPDIGGFGVGFSLPMEIPDV